MQSTNKRIAKNTLFLYFRMLLTMGVALYSSRIVLEVLGASDYGLYNVVGGVVSMLAFINSSMSSGTSRFITYELGRGDKKKLGNVFNVALVCHVILAMIVLVLAETIGLWFVNNQLVFSEERLVAVNTVYQASIVVAMFQFTQIPYTADIIAHENMSVYAYVSIIEVTLKLAAVLVLKYIATSDALITYAILILFVQIVVIGIYRGYCRMMYEESKWSFVRDRKLYKEIFNFAGWDVVGGLCVVTQGHGLNILLNIYFGPIVNAARAIAYQVQGAFTQFTNNFTTALNPVIVKDFAKEKTEEMIKLVNLGSLFSYYLLLFLVLPIAYKMDFVLTLWLGEYPERTKEFTLIILASMMIRALARPVVMAVHATGNIVKLNLVCGIVGLFLLPVAWIELAIGMDALSVFWTILVFSLIGNALEIYILKINIPTFSVYQHLSMVYFRGIVVTVISFFAVLAISTLFEDRFLSFVLYYLISMFAVGIVLFYVGLSGNYRCHIIGLIKDKIRR